MYKSQRISLSYPAVERLRQVYGLPEDLPPQALAGYVERMIFESLSQPVEPKPEHKTEPAPVTPTEQKPNFNKLAAMAARNQ